MVVEACICEEGCGVSHSHTPEMVKVHWVGEGERTFWVHARDLELNPRLVVVERKPSEIVVWVDWKAVAKELMRALMA